MTGLLSEGLGWSQSDRVSEHVPRVTRVPHAEPPGAKLGGQPLQTSAASHKISPLQTGGQPPASRPAPTSCLTAAVILLLLTSSPRWKGHLGKGAEKLTLTPALEGTPCSRPADVSSSQLVLCALTGVVIVVQNAQNNGMYRICFRLE